MSIIVKTKDGRLIIHEDQRLIIDMGGEFIDAITNGKFIIALLKNGRVQEFRTDGRFVRDIVGGNAVGIRFSGDIVIVKTSNGRFEQYKNGKLLSSSGNASSIIKKSKSSEAEKIGEKIGEMLADMLVNFMRLAYKKLKEKLKK